MEVHLEKRLEYMEEALKELKVETETLKKNHNSHDLVIQKLALSIEHMGNELTKSVTALSKSLEAHLQEEQQSMKETVKELRHMGWKVFYGIIVAGIVATTGIKLVM